MEIVQRQIFFHTIVNQVNSLRNGEELQNNLSQFKM